MTTKCSTHNELNECSDAKLVELLDSINVILWRRHKPGEYEIEGLETLTSAVDELSQRFSPGYWES